MKRENLVVIGGSAGSLDMLIRIISMVSNPSTAIVIIIHRNNKNESTLQEILMTKTNFIVKEAEDKETIKPSFIYIAPPDYHLLVERNHSLSLDASEKVNFSRPSIDVTFQSAAIVYKNTLACILLSGANADGVEGLLYAKGVGGFVAVQDPLTAPVAFMPQEAINNVAVDLIIQPDKVEHALGKIDQFFETLR